MSYRKYIKKYWPYFIFGPISRIIAAIGEFIVPYLSALMINNGAAKNNTDYILYISFIMAGRFKMSSTIAKTKIIPAAI